MVPLKKVSFALKGVFYGKPLPCLFLISFWFVQFKHCYLCTISPTTISDSVSMKFQRNTLPNTISNVINPCHCFTNMFNSITNHIWIQLEIFNYLSWSLHIFSIFTKFIKLLKLRYFSFYQVERAKCCILRFFIQKNTIVR